MTPARHDADCSLSSKATRPAWDTVSAATTGWCAYDEGRHAAAERHFLASLRSAASAHDPTLGAVTLAFWANLRYAAPESQPGHQGTSNRRVAFRAW